MSQSEESQTNKKKALRVAIVHDFLLYPGGAERVLEVLSDLYPDAPIYTLLHDERKMGLWSQRRTVKTSFLQKWPQFLRKRHRFLLPFYASAIESFDLREFDLVISSSGAWSKGLVTRLHSRHIAYIHSPMRYAWDENEHYMKRVVKRNPFFVRQLLSYLRVWDYQAAQRPDVLIANSLYSAERIEKYYRRESQVVYPPVEVLPSALDQREILSGEKSFLMISRLVPYKNILVAIDVCNKLRLPLTIIGEGPQKQELIDRSGETITFTSWVDEEEKWRYIANARALLFPVEDDFGIVAVEALAAGVPIVGLEAGGLVEIVIDGKHGIVFAQPTVEVMADGIRRFIEREAFFDPEVLKERASLFSRAHFELGMKRSIDVMMNNG